MIEWIKNKIKKIVREELATFDLLPKTKSVTGSIPRDPQEKCTRCGFSRSAHIDGYCPVGRPAETKAKFLGALEVAEQVNEDLKGTF